MLWSVRSLTGDGANKATHTHTHRHKYIYNKYAYSDNIHTIGYMIFLVASKNVFNQYIYSVLLLLMKWRLRKPLWLLFYASIALVNCTLLVFYRWHECARLIEENNIAIRNASVGRICGWPSTLKNIAISYAFAGLNITRQMNISYNSMYM